MTSVKEFRIDREPTPDALGEGAFVFTDDYSVFDWGTMPDTIPDKGASLCTTGAYTFERLEVAGVETHYRGVVDDGDPERLDAVAEAPREMAIELTTAPELPHVGRDYDYDAYFDAVGHHYLVPLEIVFRNRVPVGSSLRRRTEPSDHSLDLDAWPDEAVALDEPIVEFSTKFEASDRYLEDDEADRIAGPADLGTLRAVARAVNRVVTDRADAVGLVHQDGKIECLYDHGTVRVADVAGTFDENRFSFRGHQVSKEVLRQFYKREQPGWTDAVSEAKTQAERRGITDWRSLCDVEPAAVPGPVVEAAADLYRAGANTYTGRDWFDAPALAAAVTVAVAV